MHGTAPLGPAWFDGPALEHRREPGQKGV